MFGERVEEREGLLQQLRKMVEQEKGLVVPQVRTRSRNNNILRNMCNVPGGRIPIDVPEGWSDVSSHGI